VQILTLLFARLQSARTPKFTKALLVFFATFICKHGPTVLSTAIETVQTNLFVMVVQTVRNAAAAFACVPGHEDPQAWPDCFCPWLLRLCARPFLLWSWRWCAMRLVRPNVSGQRVL
jgi:hypothetical protein